VTMKTSCSTPLFAVYLPETEDRRDTYLVVHPQTGELCAQDSFENGYCCMPLTLDEAQAQALAARMREQTGMCWQAEAAPAPCANCGRVIWADDRDFCYPQNRERTSWRAGCNHHDFGCGHEVTADSREAVMAAWNTRGARA